MMPDHECGIARELRRSCWYAILGLTTAAVLFVWIRGFVQNRNPTDVVTGTTALAFLVVALIIPLRWKLRLDPDGVSRRLLFRWDLWTWTALSSGRVRKLHSHGLSDPERPWWRRTLRLGSLDSNDHLVVMTAINEHYRLPPPPEIPAIMTIKFGFRRSVTFDANGIHLLIGATPHEYMWTDVREVHITRMDPLRRDFRSLEIALPDRTIDLRLVSHQGGTTANWRGVTAEEINEYVLDIAPADRIHVSIAGQDPVKTEHIEAHLVQATKRLRQTKIMVAVFTPMFAALFLWPAFSGDVALAVFSATMTTLLIGPIFVFLLRAQARRVDDLNQRLDANGGAAGSR